MPRPVLTICMTCGQPDRPLTQKEAEQRSIALEISSYWPLPKTICLKCYPEQPNHPGYALKPRRPLDGSLRCLFYDNRANYWTYRKTTNGIRKSKSFKKFEDAKQYRDSMEGDDNS